MIRVICPNCQSKLDAKDKVAGQKRKCPKCGKPVYIPRSDEASPQAPAEPDDGSAAAPPEEAPVRHVVAPERLLRQNRYLICDRSRVIAVWEGDGQGWMVRTDFGFASAARNPDKLPSQGDFRLIEVRMSVEHEKPLLQALTVFQLAKRWALTNIPRGEDAVLKSITGPAGLNREQKNAVRKYLGDRMMRETWGDNRAVLDYLGDYDFHTPGAG
jgi:hypothetical protein